MPASVLRPEKVAGLPPRRQVIPVFDLTTAVVVYCGLVAALYLGLWLFYDRRDRTRFERPRRKHAFFCIRCNQPYAAASDDERVPCPRCAYENGRLRF